MDKRIKKIAAAMGLSGMMILSTPANAQSAEETINVGVDVQIAQPPIQIRRLDDINISYDPATNSADLVSEIDHFCLYVPDSVNIFLETIGTNINEQDDQKLALAESQSGELKQLSYRLTVGILSNDGPFNVFSTTNRTHEVNISTLSLLFNEEDCGGNENMNVTIAVSGLSSTASLSNGAVIESLSPGETYQFTDQVTMIVTPDI